VPKFGYPGFNINETASKNVLFEVKVNQRLETQCTSSRCSSLAHALGIKIESAIDFGPAVSEE
jgi:hypothetical protein